MQQGKQKRFCEKVEGFCDARRTKLWGKKGQKRRKATAGPACLSLSRSVITRQELLTLNMFVVNNNAHKDTQRSSRLFNTH